MGSTKVYIVGSTYRGYGDNMINFDIGDEVVHEKYGEGVLKDVSVYSSQVWVYFPSEGDMIRVFEDELKLKRR